MQYLYKLRTRYGVVHVDLGPVFMISRLHLQLLWRELRATALGGGELRAIVERRTRLRDLRADETAGAADLLCGLETHGLRVLFMLNGAHEADALDELAALAQDAVCALQRFPALDDALNWAGLGEPTAVPTQSHEPAAHGVHSSPQEMQGWPAFA